MLLKLAILLPFTMTAASVSVLTNRYDNQATGANPKEKILNTRNVTATGFGKLYTYAVEGSVFAQPLYMPGLKITGPDGKAVKHNVLFVATMEDRVYAFDADTQAPALWTRNFTDPGKDIVPVPVTDIAKSNFLNVVGNVGILSTPVIDPARKTIYLLARTREGGRHLQRLYALDIQTGQDRVPPVTIDAEVPGRAKDAVDGMVRFNARTANQRPALALTRGKIIIAWASHEDVKPYHGWIMAYDGATLHQDAVLNITPHGMEGGIWQCGRGPAIDAKGHIYFETGNGDWDGKEQFGETLLKLTLTKTGFRTDDFYTPANYVDLNKRDADFGSTGPTLIPHTNTIICGDKKGVLTLFDTRNLKTATQEVSLKGGRVLNGPAYYEGPSGSALYLWGEADFLRGFRFNGPRLQPTEFAKGNVASKGSPGGALTVSSDSRKPGTGVVWGMKTVSKSADHGNAPGMLHAYNAETLEELWNSERNPGRDRLGTLVKFVPPVVVNGKVYAVSYDGAVHVYGLVTR